MCARPATLSLFRRRRIVPSIATIGIEEMNSGMTGLFHAACSSAASVAALSCSMRERPEPFSITRSAAARPFRASHFCTARLALRALPGAPPSSAPSVRKRCRAITLLENLLVSRTNFRERGRLGGVEQPRARRHRALAYRAAPASAHLRPELAQGAGDVLVRFEQRHVQLLFAAARGILA